MAILKNRTQGNFTLVSSTIVRDTSLSLDERGMLLTLLSLPDNWELTIRGLCKILPNGKEKIAKTINSLEGKGYLVREQGHLASGRFDTNYIEVFDSPQIPKNTDTSPCPENPDTVNPYTAKPSTDEPHQYNKQKIKNQKIKNTTTSSPRARTRTRRRDDDASSDKSNAQTLNQYVDHPADNHSLDNAAHKVTDKLMPPETISQLRGLGLEDRDIKAILYAANNDSDRITKAIKALEDQPGHIKSVTGWLIKAIKQEYNSPVGFNTNKNTVHFATERKYDFDEIEELLLGTSQSRDRARTG